MSSRSSESSVSSTFAFSDDCMDFFENRSHFLDDTTIGLNDFANLLDDRSEHFVNHSMGFVL
jgi:hypothetical protein